MTPFAKFLSVNGLKRKDIAFFLGVSGAFITQIASGDRPLPDEKLAMIKANTYGWDVSMLTREQSQGGLHGLDVSGLLQSNEITPERLRSAVESALNPEENPLVSYLERKVENQEALIYELRKQIWALEQELKSARKGENAGTADGFLSAHVI